MRAFAASRNDSGGEEEMRRRIITLAGLLLAGVFAALGQTVLVEAEGFEWTGGWVTDQQFMDQMGSPYLLAHGLGKPVADAKTEIQLPKAGTYRVWVRTRDWVAPWKAPGAPGRFQVLIDEKPLNTVFGTEGAAWHWEDGGTVNLSRTKVSLVLRDLTGFDGRCDAILFAADAGWNPPDGGEELASFRRGALGLSDKPVDGGEYDLVVVGGGMAGITSAVSAARLGLRVALIQNRPVLGGNNSSEVRVHLGGNIRQEPYPALGGVVAELDSGGHGNARPAAAYDDERKLAVVRGEENLELFLSTHATKVETEGSRIASVTAVDIPTGRELRFRAPLFVDCTGDGTIGYLAGADFRVGREARSETGESLAPEEADKMVMGASVMWYAAEQPDPIPFPEISWGLPITEETAAHLTRGDWNWETGMNRDQIEEAEFIRDQGLRAAYSNWSFLKNRSKRRSEYEKQALAWVAYIAGKRESRRLMGDVILQEQDIQEQRTFPDAAVTATWSIDLHYPQPDNAEAYGEAAFRSYAVHTKKRPYTIPYRCLYSRNIENLFMAGRNISVTHVALGTVRVMRTTGMMGEVVGMAASICKKHNTFPRAVYEDHLAELKELMRKGVGKESTQ